MSQKDCRFSSGKRATSGLVAGKGHRSEVSAAQAAVAWGFMVNNHRENGEPLAEVGEDQIICKSA